ncbi:hypothetical protein PGB90_000824 [Kerria lacca]
MKEWDWTMWVNRGKKSIGIFIVRGSSWRMGVEIYGRKRDVGNEKENSGFFSSFVGISL